MILDAFRLDGKVAIVTGAGRGLGQGLAVALAEAGADIAAVGLETSLLETRKRIEAVGRKVAEIQADVSNPDDVHRIIDETLAAYGRFDILINNAGVIRRYPAHEFPLEEWDAVMAVNLRGLFLLTQAFGKVLISEQKGGKVVNICSMLSFSGGILVAPYTASKSAVAGLTRLLGNEWAPYGIHVNGIAPGYMATDNTAPLREDPVRNREILSRIPMGRWGSPDDLGGAAVFLCSDASAYVTGTILRVDGGWLAR